MMEQPAGALIHSMKVALGWSATAVAVLASKPNEFRVSHRAQALPAFNFENGSAAGLNQQLERAT